MVNAEFPQTNVPVRCRTIAAPDLEAVAQLLHDGFRGRRTLAFWRHVLDTLDARPAVDALPKYGYLLESVGRIVGAILMISSRPGTGADPDAVRCNVSSWYVQPEFRGYATLLSARALKHKNVTYLNASAAPNTRPIAEAQGYTLYSKGLFVAMPALQRPTVVSGVKLVAAGHKPDAPHEDFEHDLLVRHAAYGCTAFWCVDADRAYPFCFRFRAVKRVVPYAQLIYCRDVATIARFAGPIGRRLAVRGRPLVVIDANGPVPGLLGRYFDGAMPKYFKGAERPRLGDLADTEAAMFGM